MGIIVWFRKGRLQKRKKSKDLQLTEIRIDLNKIKRQKPKMRLIIDPELGRIRELKKQLTKVRTKIELRSWLSLFEMCVPVFNALINTSHRSSKMKRVEL